MKRYRQLLVALLCLALLCFHATVLLADEARYALVIGANRGGYADQQLSFAAEDAARVSGVLTELGGFLPEDVVLLKEPDANRVRGALSKLNARIRDEQLKDRRTLLVVFYSGHADSLALHLGGSELPWEELRNATAGSSADVRLLIVDACRSGSATKVKGARLDKPFALPEDDTNQAQGFAILSSAAAGEDAQESEELRASFFSHHFISALRGVADNNNDGVVTLSEAYRYTADRTVASSAATLAGIQHPTYAYDLRGRTDLVLTHPSLGGALSSLYLALPGQYLFHEKNTEGPIALEANVGAEGRRIFLSPGNYFVRRREPDRLWEGKLHLTANTSNALSMNGFHSLTYAQLVRKGGGARSHVWGASLWGGLSGTPLAGYGVSQRYAFLTSLERRQITLDLQLRLSRAQADGDKISGNLLETGASFGMRKVIDIESWFSASFGVRGGFSYYRQSYDTTRIAPKRYNVAPSTDTILRADFQLGKGYWAGFEYTIRWQPLKVRINEKQEESSNTIALIGLLGLGRQW